MGQVIATSPAKDNRLAGGMSVKNSPSLVGEMNELIRYV